MPTFERLPDDLDLALLIESAVRPLVGLLFVLVGYAIVARLLRVLEGRGALSVPLIMLLRRVVRWLTAAAVVVIVLSAFGVLENAWAALSAFLALVAIGFVAVWSVLSNTLCSLIMMVVRPFTVGDTIEFPPDDIRGKVVNFNLLFTTLRTENEGEVIQVPNNMFFQRFVRRQRGESRIRLDDQLLERRDAKV